MPMIAPARHVMTALLAFALAFAAAVLACPVDAAVDEPVSPRRQIEAALEAGRHAGALPVIEQLLDSAAHDGDLLYQAARCYSVLGQREQAADHLIRAVRAGFRRFEELEYEPDLEPLWDHPAFVAVLEAREQLERRAGERALSRWRSLFDEEAYRFEIDDRHHLVFVNALDDVAHHEMRTMLADQAEHLIAGFFEAPLRAYVLVAVPRPRDAGQFLGQSDVGGLYDHSTRQLISRNIGGSLRHEFFHVYHHHHMDMLDQKHPLWIQEGLACLYEDAIVDADGQLQFMPNERVNVIKRRVGSGYAMPWAAMFDISRDRFMRDAKTLYPQAYAVFRYVAEQGKLAEWYDAYVLTFDEDPTGRAAFEQVFDRPLAEIEREWRRWVRDLEGSRNTLAQGTATLGVMVDEHGTGDGVRVVQLSPGSAADLAGIEPEDVIVSIDDRPTRSFNELINIVRPKQPGDTVTVRLRRGEAYRTVTARLKPFRPHGS